MSLLDASARNARRSKLRDDALALLRSPRRTSVVALWFAVLCRRSLFAHLVATSALSACIFRVVWYALWVFFFVAMRSTGFCLHMASPAKQATEADHEVADGVAEEDEAEDVVDDAPMRITGRVFIGSIDAARNATALQRWRIGGVLAVHTKEEAEAAGALPSVVGVVGGSTGDNDELQCTRITVAMADSSAADWLRTIPGILAELETLLYGKERWRCARDDGMI